MTFGQRSKGTRVASRAVIYRKCSKQWEQPSAKTLMKSQQRGQSGWSSGREEGVARDEFREVKWVASHVRPCRPLALTLYAVRVGKAMRQFWVELWHTLTFLNDHSSCHRTAGVETKIRVRRLLLLIQMMKDGSLNQGGGSGDNEIYLDSECIFEGRTNQICLCVSKQGVTDNSKVLTQSQA